MLRAFPSERVRKAGIDVQTNPVSAVAATVDVTWPQLRLRWMLRGRPSGNTARDRAGLAGARGQPGGAMSFEFVRYEKRGRVAIVTLDRPDVLNSIHPPTSAELDEVWDDFADDDELWVAILTGSGRAFCTGNDLKYLAKHGLGGAPSKGGFGGLTHRLDLWKPVIAAVNGHAVAGGMELALACDLIVAAESATFGLVEPRRGLAPLAGGIHRLPRQLPMKLAMELILTARTFSAQRALELSLVNQVVPADDVLPAAMRLADEILECAPLSIQACKQGALMGLEVSLGEALRKRYPAVGKLLKSKDFKEGPRAFVERRKPNWSGR